MLADRYRLDSRAGAGGMATIYRARDLTLDRDVAVKVLHPHLMDDEGLRERFRTEARHAAKLLHPNIVNVFDTGDRHGPDGLPWIVMEFVDGPSLREVITQRSQLSPAEALSIVEPVASALARAHEGGLIHRDIKPENVLIAADGTPKVADFGIARAVAETSHTQTGTLIGSVHYMAPELVSGKPATTATDQYALGIVLYELLTGSQPLPAESPMAIALRHAQEPVPPAALLAPDIPAALDHVIARATALRPEDRYADMASFASALRAAIPQGPQPVVVHATLRDGRDHTLVIPAAGATTTVVAPTARQKPSRLNRAGQRAKRPQGPRFVPQRRGTKLAVLATVLLLLGSTMLWAFVIAPPIEVPDLASLTLAEARDVAAPLGVDIAAGEPRHSREITKGRIVAQDPAPDGRLRKGGVITVHLSLGPQVVAMPSVLGLSEDEAREALGTHGFAVRVDRGWHDLAPKDTVAGQQPEPQTRIDEGAEVVIYVSDGIEQVQVPDLSGLTRESAQAALTEAKLTAVFVVIYSDDEPKRGSVVAQSIEAGRTVDKGSEVEVQVWGGPMTFKIPNVEGKSISDGRAILENLGLKVRVVEQARPQVGPFKRGQYGRVEAQDPQPGKKVQRGDSVTLYTFSRAADEEDD